MLRSLALGSAAFLLAGAIHAQEPADTLERIAETGEFRIGFVPDAPPLSFIDENGKAAGYSIDLCRQVASAIRNELGLDQLKLSFTPLIAIEDRIGSVENGTVDIECGATTVTLSRRERVDFSLMTFITGSAVLSQKKDPIGSPDELDGKRIAVISGTTTEDVLREFLSFNDFDIALEFIENHDDGMKLLNADKVDGYASDRAMLIGQVFRDANADIEYTMMQSVLSFEPYGLMIQRGDTEFRLAVDRALAALYRTARIRRIYHTWFGRYGEELSPIVAAMYQFQAVGE